MNWRMAESLDVLLDEVDDAAPDRSTASDGGIGDEDHATRDSDHNPWIKVDGEGVVRARDFTDDKPEFSAAALAEHVANLLGKHPALGLGAYVIWNRRIISTAQLSLGWRTYGGSNPHDKHVHISVGIAGFDTDAPWGWTEGDDMTPEQDELLRQTAKTVERLAEQEKRRAEREVARDKRRHQKVMTLLNGVPADTAAAVIAVLEEA